ncbi:MAG: hypothetical protein KGZ58_13415 [Ignavibacteriales bacterium]|nr:hypothetical protein [Ignavibacteriales bacterium]
MKEEKQLHFTGNEKVDLFAAKNISSPPQETIMMSGGKKSVMLAAGLSFLLPGAGEYYTESFWQSGIFFAAEVTGITVGLVYNNKAIDQTTFFKSYADKHWNVVKYVEWIYENISTWGITNEYPTIDEIIIANNQYPWKRVNWNKITELERAIGGSFSHTLPRRPEQQYYELIGKYHQFRAGWSDYDSTFADYTIPNRRDAAISPNFTYYSKERGKANDYYTIAKRAVNLVLLNHILSAIDAAISANVFNNQFSSQLQFQEERTAYGISYNPVVNMKLKF